MKKLENHHSLIYGFGIVVFFFGFELFEGYAQLILSVFGAALLLLPLVVLFRSDAKRKVVFFNYLLAYSFGVVALLLFFIRTELLLGNKLLAADTTVQTIINIAKLLSIILLLFSSIYLTFIELSFRSLDISSEIDKKRLSYSRQSALLVIIIVPILVAVNYLAREKNFNIDLTHNSSYTLQENSLRILKKLDKKLEIFAFFPVGGIAVISDKVKNTNAISKEVEIMLENIRSANDKIDLQFLDYKTETQIAETLNVKSNGVVVFRTATEGAGLSDNVFRTERVSIRSIDDLKSMERKFIRSILKVNSPARIMYLTSANGEIDIRSSSAGKTFTDESFRLLKGLLRYANITIKKWESSNGYPKTLPEDCDIVGILSPQFELAPAVTKTIKDYVGTGGKVLAVLNNNYQVNLAGLLDAVAVEYQPGPILADTKQPETLEDVQLDSKHSIVKGMKEYKVKKVSLNTPGFFKKKEKAEKEIKGLTKVKLMRSGVRSYIDTNKNGKKDKDENAQNKQLALLFEKKASKQTAAVKNTSGSEVNPKLALLGDESLLSDTSLKTNPANLVLMGSLFHWLSQEDAFLGVSPKLGNVTAYALTKKKKNIMYYISLVILPLVIAAAGLFWVRYQRRKISSAGESQSDAA